MFAYIAVEFMPMLVFLTDMHRQIGLKYYNTTLPPTYQPTPLIMADFLNNFNLQKS